MSETNYRIKIIVKDIKGHCPIYKVGDEIIFNKFYIDSEKSAPVCIHAFLSMAPILYAASRGVSLKDIGIGESDDTGFLTCPDPGPPYTPGGSVLFRIERIRLK